MGHNRLNQECPRSLLQTHQGKMKLHKCLTYGIIDSAKPSNAKLDRPTGVSSHNFNATTNDDNDNDAV